MHQKYYHIFVHVVFCERMDVYLVSFSSSHPPRIVREIAHMVDGTAGMRVFTNLFMHSTNRRTPKDYDSMVAFSFDAPRTYKLDGLPVYIDDRYMTVYYSKYALYAVVKRDLSNNAWNIVRTLLPAPDVVMNAFGREHRTIPRGMMYVDTEQKPALFDRQDVIA